MKKGKLMITMMAVCSMMVAVLSFEAKTDIDDLVMAPASEQTFVADCSLDDHKTDIDYL